MSAEHDIPNVAHESVHREEAETPENKSIPPKKRGRARLMVYTLLAFLVIAVIAFLIWWFEFRNYESTDDAYIHGNMVVLMSRQTGSVIAYFADDTDYVEEGQILVEIDPTDYLLNFEQKRTALEIAARQVREQIETVKERQSDVALKTALYQRALIDFNNRKPLVDSEAISREDYTHARAELAVAKASLKLSKHKLASAKAALGCTLPQHHPLIKRAKAEMREAYLELQRCKIYAPVAGFVAKRSVEAGNWIETTTPLMSIIPLDYVWVEANYKETQLENIRIGQPVEITVDMYGSDVLFHGRVGGIQAGSGSVFSLLPAQNATGNWIKIVQRVPVRIYLESEEIKTYPLFLGLSVYSTVNIANTSGQRLSEHTIPKPIMETTVFEIPCEEVNRLMDKIVAKNLGCHYKRILQLPR